MHNRVQPAVQLESSSGQNPSACRETAAWQEAVDGGVDTPAGSGVQHIHARTTQQGSSHSTIIRAGQRSGAMLPTVHAAVCTRICMPRCAVCCVCKLRSLQPGSRVQHLLAHIQAVRDMPAGAAERRPAGQALHAQNPAAVSTVQSDTNCQGAVAIIALPGSCTARWHARTTTHAAAAAQQLHSQARDLKAVAAGGRCSQQLAVMFTRHAAH